MVRFIFQPCAIGIADNIQDVDCLDAILEAIVEHPRKRRALGLRGKDDLLALVWPPFRCTCRLRIRQVGRDHIHPRPLGIQRRKTHL